MIRIVSDSSTLYSIKQAEEKGFSIAPLSVTINKRTYKEFEDINTVDFISIINEGYMPTSSQPSIGEVLDIYNKYPEDEIINISMADGLSGTYNSACTAKNMDKNPDRINVINSKTLCGPQRYLVELAVSLVNKGLTREEIIKEIHEIAETSISFLIPRDFDFLVRGGRLSPLVGKIGSAIKLVPVMTLSEDSTTLVKFTTKRTFRKAIGKICDVMLEHNVDSGYKIYICHGNEISLAEEAKSIILEYIKNADIEIHMLGPVFTTQGGPGCLSIQFIKKYEELI
ncbi:MAG: DegV family protein [Clostridiales bacterium]|nr:DegV family protein [Clostridiales bacterium]